MHWLQDPQPVYLSFHPQFAGSPGARVFVVGCLVDPQDCCYCTTYSCNPKSILYCEIAVGLPVGWIMSPPRNLRVASLILLMIRCLLQVAKYNRLYIRIICDVTIPASEISRSLKSAWTFVHHSGLAQQACVVAP